MAIHFDMDRMAEVKDNYRLWWEGKLARPIANITLSNAYPVDRKTTVPLLTQANCSESWTAEQIIDAWDAELSSYEFLGDAYPFVPFHVFGPGILSAFSVLV